MIPPVRTAGPILALAAALLAGCVSAPTRPREVLLDAAEVVLPRVEGTQGPMFLLSTLVNGKGPFAFLLDTGLATTVVSPEVARHRSGEADSSYRAFTLRDGAGNAAPVQGAARMASVRIGGLELRDLDVCILGLEGLSGALGRRIDGILGYPCFAGGLLTIDYLAGEVRFSEGSLDPVDHATVFPLAGVGDPTAHLLVEGKAIPVLLDTGSEAGVTLVDPTSAVEFHAPPIRAGARSGPAGRIAGERLARVRGTLRLGPCLLRDPVVRLKPGTRGVIGTGVLDSFRVVLDLANGRYALEGGPRQMGFAPIHGTGASLWFEGDALVAREVIPGSPAEAAGLREGDRVVSVDGVPPVPGMIAALRTRMKEPGAVLRLQVRREGRELLLDLEVRTVVP